MIKIMDYIKSWDYIEVLVWSGVVWLTNNKLTGGLVKRWESISMNHLRPKNKGCFGSFYAFCLCLQVSPSTLQPIYINTVPVYMNTFFLELFVSLSLYLFSSSPYDRRHRPLFEIFHMRCHTRSWDDLLGWRGDLDFLAQTGGQGKSKIF